MGNEPNANDGKESASGFTGELNGALADSTPEDSPAVEDGASSSSTDPDEFGSETPPMISGQEAEEKENTEDLVVGGVYQAIAKMEVVQHQLRLLHQDFDIKFKEDLHKEKIIDNLHEELQAHKNNIFSVQQQSMAMDMIKIMDDIRKFGSHHRAMNARDWDVDKLLDFIEQLPSDIEDLFLLRGITPYQEMSAMVDPARQRVVTKVVTEDPLLDKMIAARLRPGYECDGRIIRPEMVAVYVYEPAAGEDELGVRDSDG